jgi:hypothetical protein
LLAGKSPSGGRNENVRYKLVFHVRERLQQPVSGNGHAPRSIAPLLPEVDAAWLALTTMPGEVPAGRLEIVERHRNLL